MRLPLLIFLRVFYFQLRSSSIAASPVLLIAASLLNAAMVRSDVMGSEGGVAGAILAAAEEEEAQAAVDDTQVAMASASTTEISDWSESGMSGTIAIGETEERSGAAATAGNETEAAADHQIGMPRHAPNSACPPGPSLYDYLFFPAWFCSCVCFLLLPWVPFFLPVIALHSILVSFGLLFSSLSFSFSFTFGLLLSCLSGIVIVVDLRSGAGTIVMRSERAVPSGEQKSHDGMKKERESLMSWVRTLLPPLLRLLPSLAGDLRHHYLPLPLFLLLGHPILDFYSSLDLFSDLLCFHMLKTLWISFDLWAPKRMIMDGLVSVLLHHEPAALLRQLPSFCSFAVSLHFHQRPARDSVSVGEARGQRRGTSKQQEIMTPRYQTKFFSSSALLVLHLLVLLPWSVYLFFHFSISFILSDLVCFWLRLSFSLLFCSYRNDNRESQFLNSRARKGKGTRETQIKQLLGRRASKTSKTIRQTERSAKVIRRSRRPRSKQTHKLQTEKPRLTNKTTVQRCALADGRRGNTSWRRSRSTHEEEDKTKKQKHT